MALFYERIENPETVRIVFRFEGLYHLLSLLAILGMGASRVAFNDCLCSSAMALVFFIPFLLYYLDTRQAYSEWRRARKDGACTTSGKTFSISQPFTVEIRRKPAG